MLSIQSVIDGYTEPFQQWLIKISPKLLAGGVIILLGLLLARFLRKAANKALKVKFGTSPAVNLIGQMVYFSTLVIILISALSSMGFPINSLLTALGAIGVGIALALKDSLSNIAATFLTIANSYFEKDDYVQIGSFEGVVEETRILTTRLRTSDNKTIHVPNARIISDGVVNYTQKGIRRVDLMITLAQGSDIRRARTLVQELMVEDSRILSSPEPMAGVVQIIESGVQFVIRPWVKSSDFTDVQYQLLEAVKERFENGGIGIAVVQRTVQLVNTTAPVGSSPAGYIA